MFPRQFGIRCFVWAVPILLGFAVAEPSLMAAPMNAAEGRIVSLDRYGMILADQESGVERVFVVRQNTKIMRNGDLARLTDLRPGDGVRVTFRPLGDRLLAQTVTAFGPGTP